MPETRGSWLACSNGRQGGWVLGMGKRYIYGTSTGGLCNRLLMLAGSLRIGELTGREFLLHWPVNDHTGCQFEDLFSNTFERVGEPELRRILQTSVKVKVYNKEGEPSKPYFRALSSDGDPDIDITIVKGWDYPLLDNEQDDEVVQAAVRRMLLTLQTHSQVTSLVANFELPKSAVGVHVRRSDCMDVFGVSKLEYFVTLMQAVLARQPGTRFFLATDDRRTEEELKGQFGEQILVFPKTAEGRQGITAMREALVDLLLLSRTRGIIGNVGSSYSKTAALLAGRPLVLALERALTTDLEQSLAALTQ